MIPGTQKEAIFLFPILSVVLHVSRSDAGTRSVQLFLLGGKAGVQPSSLSRFGMNVMRRFTKVNFGISTVALAQGVMLKGVLLGKGGWSFVFWVGVGSECFLFNGMRVEYVKITLEKLWKEFGQDSTFLRKVVGNLE